MVRSIRGRVILLVIGAQLLAATCAVGVAVWYVRRALWTSFDARLQARMVAALALVDQLEGNPSVLTFDRQQSNIPKDDLFYIQDVNGSPVAGSAGWITDNDRARRAAGKTWSFRRDGIVYRGRALLNTPILDQDNHQIPQQRVNLYYAIPADRMRAQVAATTRIAAGVVLLTLLLSAGFIWWAVGRGLRPLTDLAQRADSIEPNRAQFQEPAGTVRSAELAPLVRALRSLADRVQAAFQRERQFLSDAAHELKTAVAIQKSTLQLLEQGNPSEGEYREGIARALEDTARTEHLVADMLLLSSIEHGQLAAGRADANEEAADLNESLLVAIDRLTPLAQMRAIAIDFTPDRDYPIAARQADLGLLWTNLIENAIQHSPKDSRVLIEVDESAEKMCRVRILDEGTGISCVDLPHVFERFYRSDASRSRSTGGFGLGLSIAKAIVDSLHGSIELQSVPNAGTTVEVELPIALAVEGSEGASVRDRSGVRWAE